MTINTLPEANYLEFLLWIIRQRQRLKVTGSSMLPLLQPGEEILVATKAYRKSLPKIGDVVVLKHPQENKLTIVKRILDIDQNCNCFLIGDNLTQSSDSRHWGLIKSSNLIGKVTSRFS